MRDDRAADSITVLEDWVAYVENRLGNEPWITVCLLDDEGAEEQVDVWSVMLPADEQENMLTKSAWGIRISYGHPEYETDDKTGEVRRFLRFGADSPFEALVYLREFGGVKSRYVELCEEFRLFYNMYHDASNKRYIMFDINGDPEEVVRYTDRQIKVSLRYLRFFLAVKRMRLAVCFEIQKRESSDDTQLSKSVLFKRADNVVYEIFTSAMLGARVHRLTGKKMIEEIDYSSARAKNTMDYSTFIVGYDRDGDLWRHSCNPDLLHNGPTENNELPHFYTPVFFKRQLLQKYYESAGKYSVSSFGIRCLNLWAMRLISLNYKGYVVAWLGDLGQRLPRVEQAYWSQFNVPPVKFDEKEAEQVTVDYRFKVRYEALRQDWPQRMGWTLYRDLGLEDENIIWQLHVPMTNERAEFDQQTLWMAKLLIDAVHDSDLKAQLPSGTPSTLKSIGKLEAFFQSRAIPDYETHIQFLRNLWDIRHGAGHLKKGDYERGAERLKLKDRDLVDVSTELFESAFKFVDFLEKLMPPQ